MKFLIQIFSFLLVYSSGVVLAEPSGTAYMGNIIIPRITRTPFLFANLDTRCIWYYSVPNYTTLTITNTSGYAAFASAALAGFSSSELMLFTLGNGTFVKNLYVRSGAGSKTQNDSIMAAGAKTVDGVNYSGSWTMDPVFKVLVNFVSEPDGPTGTLQTTNYNFIQDPSSTLAVPAWHGRSLSFSYGYTEMRGYPQETGTYSYSDDEDCGG
jgi:hypothetical protein